MTYSDQVLEAAAGHPKVLPVVYQNRYFLVLGLGSLRQTELSQTFRLPGIFHTFLEYSREHSGKLPFGAFSR